MTEWQKLLQAYHNAKSINERAELARMIQEQKAKWGKV
jgi:hypothetical protein